MNAFKIQDDARDNMDIGSNVDIQTQYGLYKGTEKSVTLKVL